MSSNPEDITSSSTAPDRSAFGFFGSVPNQDVRITEMPHSNGTGENGASVSDASSLEKDKYIIEEPLDYGYDYIFEPHHNKSSSQASTTSSSNGNGDKSPSHFKFATSIGEINGVLEYEYKSYTFKCDKDNESTWLNEWEASHMDSNVRGLDSLLDL